MILIFALLLNFESTFAQTEQDLKPPAADVASAPELTVFGASILMSWLEPHDKTFRLRWAELNDGKWSGAQTISESTKMFVNPADRPSVMRLNSTQLFAHWLSATDAKFVYDVTLGTSADGGATWKDLGPLRKNREPGSKGYDGFFSYVPEAGGARAFWIDGREDDGTESKMSLRTAMAGESMSGETVLDANVCACCRPSPVVTAGGPMVFYRGRTSGEIRDIQYVRMTAGRWEKPRTLHADGWKIGGCPVNGPDAAAQGAAVVAAWFTAAGGKPHVRVAYSRDSGSKFSPFRELGTDAAFVPRGYVQSAFLANGEAVAIWLASRARDSRLVLLARKLSKKGELGKTIPLIEFGAGQDVRYPQLAVQGDFLILAWTETHRNQKGTPESAIAVRRIKI